jgi:hypothetical protein
MALYICCIVITSMAVSQPSTSMASSTDDDDTIDNVSMAHPEPYVIRWCLVEGALPRTFLSSRDTQ